MEDICKFSVIFTVIFPLVIKKTEMGVNLGDEAMDGGGYKEMISL